MNNFTIGSTEKSIIKYIFEFHNFSPTPQGHFPTSQAPIPTKTAGNRAPKVHHPASEAGNRTSEAG